MKTFLTSTVIVCLLGGAGLWYWLSSPDELPKLRDLPVERGDILLAISATGTVEPVEVIDVGAQIVGRVQKFGVDPSQPKGTVDFCSQVRKDAVLAELDDQPYQLELARATANKALAEAELLRYEAQLKQAEQAFARAEELRDTNPESDYERALAQRDMAKADLAVGKAKMEQAKLMEKEAKVQLEYTIIQAPIDGVVIDRRVNVGQTVVAGLNAPSLFLLAEDLSRMQVWAAVNEADIGDIQVGQRVTFKVDAYRERTFEGLVSQIRLNAGMSHNVVTYGVVVDIDNADGTLLPYMTANLQFEVASRSEVVIVPNQALRWQPQWNQVTPASGREKLAAPEGRGEQKQVVETDTPTLWVAAEDGLVRPVEVTVGLTDGTISEIVGGGVEPNDSVIVGTVRKAQRDFVSSFISKVIN